MTLTQEQQRLAAIRELVRNSTEGQLRQDIRWLLDQLEQAQARENVDKTALREMLGSYEALARMAAAGDARPVEQVMQWDGPICARRALAAQSEGSPDA